MQPILHRHPQVVEASRPEGGGHQGGAGEIINRILPGNFRRQGGPGHLGFQLKIRDEHGEADPLGHRHGHGVHPSAVHHRGDQPAQHGGGDIVRMALQLRRQIAQVSGGDGAAHQSVGPQQARHQAGGGAAQPPGHGNVAFLQDPQPPEGVAAPLVQAAGGGVNHVGFVGGDGGPVGGRDVAAVGFLHPHPVIQRQGQAQGVEPGPQVGAGGRHGNFQHGNPSRLTAPRPAGG